VDPEGELGLEIAMELRQYDATAMATRVRTHETRPCNAFLKLNSLDLHRRDISLLSSVQTVEGGFR
jgi:hypothetical protein